MGGAGAAVPDNAALDLSEQLEAKQQELEEALQRYLRLAADFDNFRRRTRQEMEDVRKTAAAGLIGELLPVLDNFERALATARSLFPENVATGIDMIYRQLWHVLSQSGVQPLEAVGKSFDPVFHEAFEQVETDEAPEGTVMEEVQKGYLLHGKVLRPALVKVARRTSLDEFAEV
jgi:molecular chaperone GrpE